MRIYQNRQYLYLYLLGSLFFVSAGIFILPINILIGLSGIIFFGICGIFFIISIIKPKLLLEISEDGFYTNTWGYIEWNNIEKISISNIESQKFIMFNTKNLINKNKLRQNANKSLTGYNFDITLAGTGADIKTIYKLMLKKLPNN